MTFERCVFFTIRHPELERLQAFRRQHDPVFLQIPPHITVVFPFKSDKQPDWARVVEGATLPSEISFSRAIRNGEYFYYPLGRGRKELSFLYDEFHRALKDQGFELPDARPTTDFEPHLTVARSADAQRGAEIEAELEKMSLSGLQGSLRSLVCERIAIKNQMSVVEFERIF